MDPREFFHRIRRAVAPASAGFVLACSSGSAPSPAASTCSPSPGTYAIHYVATSDSGAACPTIPDERVVFSSDANALSDLPPTQESGGDAGFGCKSSNDGCTFAYACTADLGNADASAVESVVSSGSITYSSHGGTGTSSTVETVEGKLVSCVYVLTLTKQ
jgi:hypothetical protein